MNITIHNCESFFLDYYEKSLSPVEVAEVLFFLEENPEMKDIFESYEAVFLEHEKVNFPDKETLKRKYSKEELDFILSSEINIHNCEQFFVAHAENILPDAQLQKLDLFLASNPELKKDFDLIQKCRLPAEKITFEHKDLLKQGMVNAQNREEYFVRFVENDLNASELKQLDIFLQKNPEYKKELAFFKNTVLVPEKVVFVNKEQLKKKERKPVFISIFAQRGTYYAAAAAILVLVGLFFFLRKEDNKATYFANTKVVPVKSEKENGSPAENENAVSPPDNGTVNNSEEQLFIRKNASANKNSIGQSPVNPEEKNVAPIENNTEAPLTAKKEEEKKTEAVPAESPAVAVNTEEKKDSTATPPVQNETVASIAAPQTKTEEYETVASVVNKKLRSLLGIKKTECETSDKIDFWDLAMAAKKGVQKIIGAKTLDVNKKCDGNGEKVEYVFAAGNFEISKSASR